MQNFSGKGGDYLVKFQVEGKKYLYVGQDPLRELLILIIPSDVHYETIFGKEI